MQKEKREKTRKQGTKNLYEITDETEKGPQNASGTEVKKTPNEENQINKPKKGEPKKGLKRKQYALKTRTGA